MLTRVDALKHSTWDATWVLFGRSISIQLIRPLSLNSHRWRMGRGQTAQILEEMGRAFSDSLSLILESTESVSSEKSGDFSTMLPDLSSDVLASMKFSIHKRSRVGIGHQKSSQSVTLQKSNFLKDGNSKTTEVDRSHGFWILIHSAGVGKRRVLVRKLR